LDAFLEILGPLLFFVVIGLLSVFKRWQETRASKSGPPQDGRRAADELPERTRRMLYGDEAVPHRPRTPASDEDDVPVAQARGVGQARAESEQARPIQMKDLFDALRGEGPVPVAPPAQQQGPTRAPRPEARQPPRQTPEMRRRDYGQVQRRTEERRVYTEQPARQPAPPMRQQPQQRGPAPRRVAPRAEERPLTYEERIAAAAGHPQGRPAAQRRAPQQRTRPIDPRQRVKPAAPAPDAVRSWFTDRESLRRGFIMSEVLGLPKAIRSPIDGPPGLTVPPAGRRTD